MNSLMRAEDDGMLTQIDLASERLLAGLRLAVFIDTVNVASRLEELAGEHNVTLIASEDLLAAAHASPDPVSWKQLKNQALRGRRTPINIFCFQGVSQSVADGSLKDRSTAFFPARDRVA